MPTMGDLVETRRRNALGLVPKERPPVSAGTLDADSGRHRDVLHDDDPYPAGLIRVLADDGMLADAFAAAGFGVVLVAEDGWILSANNVARMLLQHGDGLRSWDGRLAATTAESTAKLRALIKSGAKRPDGAGASATLVLPRAQYRQPLLAHVTACDGRDTDSPPTPRAAATIITTDPERYAAPRLEAFSSLHGLTAAETRVLREIVSGQGVVTAAATLGISRATARTHLQRIFGKTGTKRQTELLCRFFNAVPSRRRKA